MIDFCECCVGFVILGLVDLCVGYVFDLVGCVFVWGDDGDDVVYFDVGVVVVYFCVLYYFCVGFGCREWVVG